VRDALNNRRLSVDPRKPGYPEKSAAYKEVLGKDRNLRTMDDPEHTAQKRMLIADFTIKRVAEMQPAIQQRVESRIDAMLEGGPPADIRRDLALPIPTMVICEMLGVPYADRDYFCEQSDLCTSSQVSSDVAAQAGQALCDYIEKLIDVKDRQPANDLISRLVVNQLRPGLISRKDVIDLGRFILIAGHETTANMITLSTLALLLHPQQADLLKGDFDPAFLTNAVDELLRYLSVTHSGRRRVALEDLTIGGHLVKAGEGVILLNSVSDRDQSEFSDPDRLDLARPNARNHLAFGGGMHRCIGALLSKCELELVHGSLWHRIPGLKLAKPVHELDFYADGSVYGMRSLPVTW
jgi:hypothetical protein